MVQQQIVQLFDSGDNTAKEYLSCPLVTPNSVKIDFLRLESLPLSKLTWIYQHLQRYS